MCENQSQEKYLKRRKKITTEKVGLILSSIKETFNDFDKESSILCSMYCVKPTSVWKLETSEKMRKNEKNRCEKGKFEKKEKK